MAIRYPPGLDLAQFASTAYGAGIAVDEAAAAAIETVLLAAWKRTEGFTLGDGDAHRRAFRILTYAAITAAAADGSPALGEAHVRRALQWVAPRPPFC